MQQVLGKQCLHVACAWKVQKSKGCLDMFRSKSENSIESRATGHWPWQALTTEETLTTSCSSACLTQCSAHHPHVHLSGNISQSSYVLALHALHALHVQTSCRFISCNNCTARAQFCATSQAPIAAPNTSSDNLSRLHHHVYIITNIKDADLTQILEHWNTRKKKYSCLVSHSSDIYL